MLIIVQTEDGTNILRTVHACEDFPAEGEILIAKGAVEVSEFIEEQYGFGAVLGTGEQSWHK